MRFSSFILLAVAPLLATFCTDRHEFEQREKENELTIVGSYVRDFNSADRELYVNTISNQAARDFLEENIPVFECPDKELEKTYYFRWWTFRKHLKLTPAGYVVTEFLPVVPWSGQYNTINCPASHHFAEGRWLKDGSFLRDYAKFWCRIEASPRAYSFPFADAVLKYYLVHRDKELLEEVYPYLKSIYAAWEDHKDESGLYWQSDGADGMEVSVSGSLNGDATGYRPTINSYMYADAAALSEIARILGFNDEVQKYYVISKEIKKLVERLWDPEARFYKVIPRHGDMSFSPVREEIGYVPWMYDIPDMDKSDAWLQLMDPQGFYAPYGPTTAEQRAPGFRISYEGHECQWNGPSWPFATAQTLTAMARCLHRFGEDAVTKADYYETLSIYSNSHRRKLDSGGTVCWIDENLNPFTGDWIARTMLLAAGGSIEERGKDYNHSTFCDLIISGLMGVQPQLDGSIVIEPLVPDGIWDYFSLSGLSCAGKEIDIRYDRKGSQYNAGQGFYVYVNGKEAAHSDTYCTKITL